MAIKDAYRTQAEDTSIETDVFFFSLLRQRSPLQRLQMGASMMRDARKLSLCGLRQRFSDLSLAQFASKVATAWLQEDCPPNFVPTGTEMTWIQDSTALAVQLHTIFSALNISYYVTGGVASITYGEPRTTRDLDIVMAIVPDNIRQLVTELEGNGFYVPGVEDVESGRMKTLGITHIESISRADLVIAGDEEFDAVKFDRRRQLQLSEGETLYFVSPEDLILNKIRWGQQSQSEKQWRDVLGVLKVQGETLDLEYLTHWARQLDLLEDLQRALSEAGF